MFICASAWIYPSEDYSSKRGGSSSRLRFVANLCQSYIVDSIMGSRDRDDQVQSFDGKEPCTGPSSWRTTAKACFVAVLSLALFQGVEAQIGKSIVSDDDIDIGENKFLGREATSDITDDGTLGSKRSDRQNSFRACRAQDAYIDLAIRWHAEVSSTIHATPLITDFYNDGYKDILIPGKESLTLVSGRTGAIDSDFEASMSRSHLYSSPILHDVDFDGVLDVMLAKYNGRIEFVKDTGASALYGMTLPRLRVKKNWFQGIQLDPNDHEHPDVGADEDDSGIGERTHRRLLEVEKATATVEENGKLTDAAAESFEELFGGDDYDEQSKTNSDGGAFLDDISDDAHVDYEDFASRDYFSSFAGDYDTVDYGKSDRLWSDDDADIRMFKKTREQASEYVWIDPHIQTTPVVGDIDNDGHEELVVAVSYFFDLSEYTSDSKLAKWVVGEDGDILKYMASGVAVYDLNTRMLKWSQHLDLSTAYTRYKAAALSSPAIADLNGDGKLEVIVGTSMGFLYVLDPVTGDALEGWPIQMGDIQGHIAVADIDQDGKLEIVAGDTRGSIAAFRGDGSEVWESHIGSAIVAGATFGDADGDGQLDIAFATMDGRVFLADAATGTVKDGWPFRTFGEITAPVLIAKVDGAPGGSNRKGMQVVVTSHDGYLYVIDPNMRCSSALNLGETSDSMVLFDDLGSSGEMSLLAATKGGNVYSIRTSSTFHPLKSRTELFPGVMEGSYVSRWNWAGVYADAGSRVPRDVRGSDVQIRFTVMDKRPILYSSTKNSYKVTATLVGVGAREMNAGDQPVIGLTQLVNSSGTYTINLPCPRSRTTAMIRLEMKDEAGSTYVDEFPLSFHVHFYRILKWLVVGPLTLMVTVILSTLGPSVHENLAR
jgi:hypothetical protein